MPRTPIVYAAAPGGFRPLGLTFPALEHRSVHIDTLDRHPGTPAGGAQAAQRRLRWVLALTLAYTAAEVAGGLA